MHPVLFTVGSVPIRSFGLMLVIGFMVAIALATKRTRQFGGDPDRIWDLSFYLIIAGVLGARLLYLAQEYKYYQTHTSELFSIQFAGLTSFGGLIGGGIALFIWCRKNQWPLVRALDIFGIPVLIAHAIGRVGCLLNGCCFGHQTSGFGVHVEGLPGLYVPAQIYDSGMVLVAVAAILAMEKRGMLKSGQSFSLAMMGYSLSRFIYEYWRMGSSSTTIGNLPITEAQVFSALMFLAGLACLILAGRPKPVASAPEQNAG
ncbi:MAG: prolipoprotein diacylglyceryl transferase [Armatimonadetes bacterium]|nr:prolipoprotein diacylglyceryl transferase [Armatimonadota bacterium]